MRIEPLRAATGLRLRRPRRRRRPAGPRPRAAPPAGHRARLRAAARGRPCDDATLRRASTASRWAVSTSAPATCPAGCVLALPDPTFGPTTSSSAALGERIVEPVFGLIGFWVPLEEHAPRPRPPAPRSCHAVGRRRHPPRRDRPPARRGVCCPASRWPTSSTCLRTDQPLLANEIGNDRVPMATAAPGAARACSPSGCRSATCPRSSRPLSVRSAQIHGVEALADECRADARRPDRVPAGAARSRSRRSCSCRSSKVG